MSVPFDRTAITSITTTGTTATVTVVSTALLTSGNLVLIEGANQDEYNGMKSITVASGTTFTFVVDSGTTTPATGTMYYRLAGAAAAPR